MKPKRIQRRRSKGWKMPDNTAYVGRPGPWGNPFIVGKHGTQAECVDLFRKMLGGFWCLTMDNIDDQEASYDHIKAHIRELRGKNLACWCREGTPCHADVLIEAANQPETI